MALKEVCIAAVDSVSGNTLEGDIIVVRDPIGVVGTAERRRYIWLVVDDSRLPADGVYDQREGSSNKFRYNIPLADADLSLNLTRARDVNDAYQPHVDIGARGQITGFREKAPMFAEKAL